MDHPKFEETTPVTVASLLQASTIKDPHELCTPTLREVIIENNWLLDAN